MATDDRTLRWSEAATLLLALTALSGCAGGAGGGGEAPVLATAPTPAPPTQTPSPAPPTQPVEIPPLPANVTAFTSFAQPQPVVVALSGTGSTTIGTWGAGWAWTGAQASSQTLTLSSEGSPTAWLQTPNRLVSVNPTDGLVTYSVGGVGLTSYGYPYSVMDGYKGVTFATPSVTGLSYLTFGWWWAPNQLGSGSFAVGSFAVGAQTPGAAIPSSGSANFTGQVAAQVWTRNSFGNPQVEDVGAPMSLAVNFASRSALFSSSDFSNSTIRYAGSSLSGQLTYAAQQNALSGALATANGQFSGPANAQFFGASAEEVGGSFVLAPASGGERIIGGFGAKR